MKKVFTILAAAVAALSLASCNKEEILAEQPTASEIKLNITVGNLDGTADTKAIKTGWTAGDKINVWFDEINYENPDLIMTYDGTIWSVGTLNKTPEESGFMYILYEGYNDWNMYRHTSQYLYPNDTRFIDINSYAMPIAYTNDGSISYTFESNTLTADIDSWQSLTKVQVVITELDPANAKRYVLKCPGLQVGVPYLNTSNISISNASYGRYTVGVANEDGVAFNFTSVSSVNNSTQTWEFTLLDTSTNIEKTYTVTGKEITTGPSTIKGIKIAESKFTKPAGPFTITSTGSTSVAIAQTGTPSPISLEYRKNEENWSSYTIGTLVGLSDGDALQFRASSSNSSFSSTNTNNRYGVTTTGEGTIAVSGNIMSLLDNRGEKTTLDEATFVGLFMNNKNLKDASGLILPADKLSDYGYNRMFTACSNLTAAPKLPATQMGTYCYQYMFSSCTKLEKAPELPATTLANYCYDHMFNNCSLIDAAPDLPATTLAVYCYGNMFNNCTSLSKAPEILPAETLVANCYTYMFAGCTSLMTAPVLPSKDEGYSNMFNGCSSLNYIKALFVPKSYSPQGDLTNWLKGVSPVGTFVYNKDANIYIIMDYCAPAGWTLVPAED